MDMSSGVTRRCSAKETRVGKPLMPSKSLMYWGLFSFFRSSSLVILTIVLILKLGEFSVKKKVPNRELSNRSVLKVCGNAWKFIQIKGFRTLRLGARPWLVAADEF